MITAGLVSRDQRLFDAWAGFVDAARLYQARVREVLELAGAGRFRAVHLRCAGWPGRFAGLDAGIEELPAGWRRYGDWVPGSRELPPGWRLLDGGLAVPDPQLAAGRWSAAALAAAGHPGDPQLVLAGLPPAVYGYPTFIAGVSLRRGDVLVSWESEDAAAESARADPAVWAPDPRWSHAGVAEAAGGAG